LPIPHGAEWISRCDLCGKAFHYCPNPNSMTVINADDMGEQRGHRWAHVRCFDAEPHE
jgi:hypothetical protein